MGSKKSGNRMAKGTKGNKGGTGRPPKSPGEKYNKAVYLSQRLFDKINIAAMKACYCDWRKYLDDLIEDDRDSEDVMCHRRF